jgi:hypothetical protein
MDVLKVFNLVVCGNKGKGDVSSGWFFNIIFAPVGILFPLSQFSILAFFTIVLFTMLIYTSDSPLLSLFNRDGKGKKNIWASIIAGFLLYVLQTSVILLFLRWIICNRTLEWEANDYHLSLQQYNAENVEEITGY